MVKGYDLFGDHGRNLPTPHGSGTRPMYADMGTKTCEGKHKCQRNVKSSKKISNR